MAAATLRSILGLKASRETQATQVPTDCRACPATKAFRESTANQESSGLRDSRDLRATPVPEVFRETKDSKGCQASPASQAHRDVREIVVLQVVPPDPEATSSPGTVKRREFPNVPEALTRSGPATLFSIFLGMRRPTARIWEAPEAVCGDSARCRSCSAA